MAELKSKTESKDCGRRGHWKGDKECTITKKKTAHLSLKAPSQTSPAREPPSRFFYDRPDGELVARKRTGYMMTKGKSSIGYTPTQPQPVSETTSSSNSMEWISVDDQSGPLPNPAGSDRTFTSGTLKNRIFLALTVSHLDCYLAIRNMEFEDLNDEGRECVDWAIPDAEAKYS